jgi:DHA1 family bicyclomycin/chloramphenicol resistance-like MFS transporter
MKPAIPKKLILFTIIIMDLLAGMEFDLFVPSFPELQTHFNLSPFWVAAMLSANFIGYTLSLFFVGILADHYGRKPIILLGLVTFVFGSVLCLWSPSYEFLLIGRFLQGVGVAAPAILSFLIIADLYPMKEQQFLMAMLNGVMNASVAASPVLGSYITLYFHWQGNFTALLGLSVLVLIMVYFFVPMHPLPKQKEVLSLKAYVPILKSKPLMLLIINFIFLCVPYWVFVGISPLLYMEDLGVSLTHFGYYQGALALVFAIGSIGYGLVIRRFDQMKMLYASFGITILGIACIGAAALSDCHDPLLITLAFIPFIIGQVIPSVILYPLTLNYMAEAKGRVSAVMQGGRLMLTSLGLQLAGYYYLGSFQNVGYITLAFLLVGGVTLYWVIKNRPLMDFLAR